MLPKLKHSLNSIKTLLLLKALKKAVELSPDKPYFHFVYGMTLYREGYYQEALSEFEKVVILEPEDEIGHNNVAFVNYNLGNIQEAIDQLEYFIENDLKSYATYSNMILFKYHLTQTEDAIQPDFERFKAEITPSDLNLLKIFYNEDLQRTERKLEEKVDENTKDFQLRKIQSLKMVLSVLEEIPVLSDA